MMNLFEISNELQNIYNAIEENEGELTPELEESLSINEENLREKLNDYSTLIRSLNADIEACEIETKRIAAIKKQKENLVDRLSNIVAEAVTKFGSSTKTGGKYYDLGTSKIQVRNTVKCEINNDVVDNISDDLNRFLHRLQENGLIGNVAFTDAFIKSRGNGFNRDDLENLNFNITFTGSVVDITDGNLNDLLKIMHLIPNGVISYNASKYNCKATLNEHKGLSFANLVENKSITIK